MQRKYKLTASAGGLSVEMTTVADAPGRDPLVAAADPDGQTDSDWDVLIGQMPRGPGHAVRRSLARAYAKVGMRD